MTPAPREPSRLPVRGTIGLLGTVGALALLLSFRGAPTPGDVPVRAAGDVPATDELVTAMVGSADDPPTASPTSGPVTLTGVPFETRWGQVQVSVTLDGTDIIDVVALELPTADRRTSQLSERVEGSLREEAIASDSADVSVVSGATYTSRAYAASLQSALDQLDARLAESADETGSLTAAAEETAGTADAADLAQPAEAAELAGPAESVEAEVAGGGRHRARSAGPARRASRSN
jgi:hypothetical protein